MPLIKTKQAAEICCVSDRTMEAWRLRGTGPKYHKLGKSVRYNQSDVDAWLKITQRQSTSETEQTELN